MYRNKLNKKLKEFFDHFAYLKEKCIKVECKKGRVYLKINFAKKKKLKAKSAKKIFCLILYTKKVFF